MLKILKDDKILDAIENPNYVRYQAKNDILICCEDDDAQGIISSDGMNIWHIEGKDNIPNREIDTVGLVEIEQEEYDILRRALDSEEKLEVINNSVENFEETKNDEPLNNESIREIVIKGKIQSMSNVCSSVIQNGFDVELSDGKKHHFALTIEDQINMIELKNLIESGETEIPYHGTNELCKYYSAEDISMILEEGERFKNYNILYFNSLKNYIKSLENTREIDAIEYGIEIPDEFKSEVFIEFLSENN